MIFFQRIAAMCMIVALALASGGCSNGVREDRTINYSGEGGSVAFQHGDDGLFVASSDGSKLDKVFDSTGILASSSPLWSPIDKRLIFTTIQPKSEAGAQVNQPPQQPQPQGTWDANPDGRWFLPGQMEYTCWLRHERTTEDSPATPIPLFTARCNHSGYVAANHAVRWHPEGQKVFYLDLLEDGLLGLHEFDLTTGNKRLIFERTAVAMLFDWSPEGNYLTCTLIATADGNQHNGTWVFTGRELMPQAEEWWHVPGSQHFATLQNFDLLEVLRIGQPSWSADEHAFAFVARPAPETEHEGAELCVANMETRQVEDWYVANQPLRDVHWHPAEDVLGFVEGVSGGQLRIAHAAGEVTVPTFEPISGSNSGLEIRRFAGWSAQGDQLAFVSPIPDAELQHAWALLFPLLPAARDRVYIADEKGGDAKLVHEGMRISFPKWSPTENQLSLWGTFSPSHRSWTATLLPWSLRPGDPAAILDGATGELSWMAVNPQEKSQVGHYYLLKQQYERAWEWYEQGAVGREPAKPPALSAVWSREWTAREPWFFEYYCLSKLGRLAEADARLSDFRKSMEFDIESSGTLFPDPAATPPDATQPEQQLELQRLVDFITPLMQAMHASEVFLSLNAASDGVDYFQSEWDRATNDYERFACGLCLTQMQLASGAHAAYADFVTSQFVPLVEQLLKDRTIAKVNELPTGQWLEWRDWLETTGVAVAAGTSLLPMGSEEFMATLTEAQVRALLPKWQLLMADSTLPCNVVVLAMQERLGQAPASDSSQVERPTFLLEELRLETPQQVDQLIRQLTEFTMPL